jgi:hypothetical protein
MALVLINRNWKEQNKMRKQINISRLNKNKTNWDNKKINQKWDNKKIYQKWTKNNDITTYYQILQHNYSFNHISSRAKTTQFSPFEHKYLHSFKTYFNRNIANKITLSMYCYCYKTVASFCSSQYKYLVFHLIILSNGYNEP